MAPRTLKAISPENAKPSKPKIVVFGGPGVGKTWASLSFPSCYYVDCEGGANLPHYIARLKESGGVYLGPDQGANDFPAMTEEIQTLATTKHHYRTLVIDSFSKIFNTQVSADLERMENSAKNKKEELGATYGKEKRPAINWTRRWLRWFDSLDMNVILIAHEKEKYLNNKPDGIIPDAWDKLSHELHLSLHITKQGAARKAKVVKTRLSGFQDNEMFDWSYAEFAARYGKDIMEAASVPVELATDAQIARYNELLSTVKVPDEALAKWEDGGPLKELASPAIAKRIAFIESLIPKAATPAA